MQQNEGLLDSVILRKKILAFWHNRHVSYYQLELGLLLTPFLLGTAVLLLLPMLLTIFLAFTSYNAFTPPQWNGLQNFITIFQRDVFWIAVRNSLIYVSFSAPLQLLGALLLALLLYHQHYGVREYRIAAFLPSVIPEVAYALIWLWIFNPLYGPLNKLLGWVGLPEQAWLVNTATALPSGNSTSSWSEWSPLGRRLL